MCDFGRFRAPILARIPESLALRKLLHSDANEAARNHNPKHLKVVAKANAAWYSGRSFASRKSQAYTYT